MKITCQKCGTTLLQVEAYIFDKYELYDTAVFCSNCYQALADQLFALNQRYRQLQEYRNCKNIGNWFNDSRFD